MGILAADRAGRPRPSAKPLVDAVLALDAAAAVERVVAGERADLLAGLHAVLAQGAGVVQLPPQGGDAAEPEEAHPWRLPPYLDLEGAHGNEGGAHEHGDDGKEEDEHGAAGDGHPIAEVGCHRSFAPLTLSSSSSPLDRSLLLWISRSLSHDVLGLCCARLEGWPNGVAAICREDAELLISRLA